MNLSALTPRQWAYVLHRIDHPDEEPLANPGNPRKQSLDRIADQLGEQLDGDELQALREMVAGKRPTRVEHDEESGRDLDAESVDEAEPVEPPGDGEADNARAFRPAKRAEAASETRRAGFVRSSTCAAEPESRPATFEADAGTARPESAERIDELSRSEPRPPQPAHVLQPRLF